MKALSLGAEIRTARGKSNTRKLRTSGMIPAVLYGLDKSSEMLGVSSRDLNKLLHSAAGENLLLDLKVGKKHPVKVLLKDVQHHPVSDDVIHIDFIRIDLKKKIHLQVPINLTGAPEGVKAGGILEQVRREIEISCLPTDIPDRIDIDVSALGIHEAVHVSDITLEKGEILTDLSRTIATVLPPKVVKEPIAAEGEEAAAIAEPTEETVEPEVITEKKKEEEK